MQTTSQTPPITDKALMGLIPQTEDFNDLCRFTLDVEERARSAVEALGVYLKLQNDECRDRAEERQAAYVAFNTRADEIEGMAAALVAAVDVRGNELLQCLHS